MVKSLFDTHRAIVQNNILQAKNKSPVKIQATSAELTGTTLSTQASAVPRTSASSSLSASNHSTTTFPPSTSQVISRNPPNTVSQGSTNSHSAQNGTALSSKNNGVLMPGQSVSSNISGQSSTTATSDTSNTLQDLKLSPARPGKLNYITVSLRQRGNPILKFVRNVPWEFGDIVPDYQMGQTTCALFLSLRYHQLNPNYIHERLKQLGHSFNLRIVLTHVDIKDPHHYLKDLAKMCLMADCTLILAFSPEEAGRYLETYKSFESKPPDLIMERTEGNFMARMTDCLTKARSVNKTDVMTLLSAFGSLEKTVDASEEDLSLCPGFGPQKAARLYKVFHEPFLKTKRKVDQNTGASTSKPSPSKKNKPSGST